MVACVLRSTYVNSLVIEVAHVHLDRGDFVGVGVTVTVGVEGDGVDGGVDGEGGADVGKQGTKVEEMESSSQ